MKVALSWIWPSRLAECSFRFERYLEGFRALGHEPVLVCARSSWSESFEAWGRHLAADRGGLREPGFWREVGADGFTRDAASAVTLADHLVDARNAAP